MVYDCFTFFNELDLLEIRLKILDGVVDKFVLVEAGETHAGKPKPLFFAENKDRFTAYADKIVHLVIDKFPAECKDSWGRENIQRNLIAEGLRECQPDDVIIISDLDEIPDPEIVKTYRRGDGVWNLNQKMYYCFLNYLDVTDPVWYLGTRLLSYWDFCHCFDDHDAEFPVCLVPEYNKGTTATKIRLCAPCRAVRNAGWHFSYLGGVDAIMRKLKAFSHQEFNREDICNRGAIEKSIREGRDILGRDKWYLPVRVSTKHLPAYLVENREKYEQLFVPEVGFFAAMKVRFRVTLFIRKRQVLYYMKKLIHVG